MDLEYNFLNFLILFGAIQGYILCVFIYQKKQINKPSVFMFILFLFSLAFLNMVYAFLDLDLFKYYRPLHLFPFPYKWIIGPAFYFYIKNHFDDKSKNPFLFKEWFLFTPALIYGFVRLYWFMISVSENSYRITQVIVDSNYFTIQEALYLTYNIVLGSVALNFLIKKEKAVNSESKPNRSIKWLQKFVSLFLFIHFINLLLFTIDQIIHDGQATFLFLYPSLIINVGFIYWIGFIGFIKPNYLFNTFKSDFNNLTPSTIKAVSEKLNNAVRQDEVYTNPHLTLPELALNLEISPKDLSKYINEFHQMNFSEFLNFHRVEKIKELMKSPEAKKYTLVKLSEDAGFSSKSSFNAAFKKIVGLTPSTYYKNLHK